MLALRYVQVGGGLLTSVLHVWIFCICIILKIDDLAPEKKDQAYNVF
jgi:hypothetical protein